MFGSVHSADGSLRRVSGSGFCSTSGPALSSESGLSLICYKLAPSQIHTRSHTLQLASVWTLWVVGVCRCKCAFSYLSGSLTFFFFYIYFFLLSVFLRSSKRPNISTAEQTLSTLSPSSENGPADSRGCLSLSPPRRLLGLCCSQEKKKRLAVPARSGQRYAGVISGKEDEGGRGIVKDAEPAKE